MTSGRRSRGRNQWVIISSGDTVSTVAHDFIMTLGCLTCVEQTLPSPIFPPPPPPPIPPPQLTPFTSRSLTFATLQGKKSSGRRM